MIQYNNSHDKQNIWDAKYQSSDGLIEMPFSQCPHIENNWASEHPADTSHIFKHCYVSLR